jgi:hypothetical protein
VSGRVGSGCSRFGVETFPHGRRSICKHERFHFMTSPCTTTTTSTTYPPSLVFKSDGPSLSTMSLYSRSLSESILTKLSNVSSRMSVSRCRRIYSYGCGYDPRLRHRGYLVRHLYRSSFGVSSSLIASPPLLEEDTDTSATNGLQRLDGRGDRE